MAKKRTLLADHHLFATCRLPAEKIPQFYTAEISGGRRSCGALTQTPCLSIILNRDGASYRLAKQERTSTSISGATDSIRLVLKFAGEEIGQIKLQLAKANKDSSNSSKSPLQRYHRRRQGQKEE